MKRILVIRGGAIGDFVLTLPGIKLLRDNFPSAHLEILGYKHIAALAEQRFYAQVVRSLEDGALASFFTKDADLPAELSDYFRSFDLVVSYLFDPARVFEANLERCGVKNLLTCPAKVTGGEHAAIQLARPLEQFGFCLSDTDAKLYPSPPDRAFAGSFCSEGMIALHPGSGSASKNWPIANWLRLADWLLNTGMAPVLLVVGGEADENQLQAFRGRSDQSGLRWAQHLPLPQLAAVLERCALFIGHDSGISHIAAAVGTPCLLLFGPSDPAVWAPINANVRVLRALSGSMSDLEQTEVRAAAASLMKPMS
jgi:heptosyltransferase-2